MSIFFIMIKGTKPGFIRILSVSFLFLKNYFMFLTNFTGLHNYDAGVAIAMPQKMHRRHNYDAGVAIATPTGLYNNYNNYNYYYYS